MSKDKKMVSEEELVSKYQQHYDKNAAYKLLKSLRKKTRNMPKAVSGAAGAIVSALGKLLSALDNPATPTGMKALIIGAIGYIVLPIDLIPDVIFPAGFADDLASTAGVVAAVAAYSTFSLKELDKVIDAENIPQEQNISDEKRDSDAVLPACDATTEKTNAHKKRKFSPLLFCSFFLPPGLLLGLTGIQKGAKYISDKLISNKIDEYCLFASEAVFDWEQRFQFNFIINMILNCVILFAWLFSLWLKTTFVPSLIVFIASAVLIVRAVISWINAVYSMIKYKTYIRQYVPVVLSHLKQRKLRFKQKCTDAVEEIFYDMYETHIKSPLKTGHAVLSTLGMTKSKQEIVQDAVNTFSEMVFSSSMKFLACKVIVFSFFIALFAFVLKPLLFYFTPGMNFFQSVMPV